MDITLFLFSGQLLLDIRHLGCCWKGKDDTVCMYVFNGDTGVLFYFALGQLTVVSWPPVTSLPTRVHLAQSPCSHMDLGSLRVIIDMPVEQVP